MKNTWYLCILPTLQSQNQHKKVFDATAPLARAGRDAEPEQRPSWHPQLPPQPNQDPGCSHFSSRSSAAFWSRDYQAFVTDWQWSAENIPQGNPMVKSLCIPRILVWYTLNSSQWWEPIRKNIFIWLNWWAKSAFYWNEINNNIK